MTSDNEFPGLTQSSDVVLSWGLPRLRDLPWRRTRDPWAILVSEVMLQQTQVPRVIPKWLAFMEAFPTTGDCAAAPLGDVLRLWQGLGYPRRARNLQLAASEVTRLGGFPATLTELLALPGVGQYTARAVYWPTPGRASNPSSVVGNAPSRVTSIAAIGRLRARRG